MRRQARLFAIADLLRARRSGITAEQLAERFEVTVRTMYRDLETLRDAGLPLNAERGRGGGYALDRAYTLPPLNLTPREAALLVTLGRWATELRLLPFAETLKRALDKIRGALSASAQRELLDLVQSLEFVGVPSLPIPEKLRSALERAWFERAPLRIRYRSSEGAVTTRTILIESVTFDGRIILLRCTDLERSAIREFRMDRIEHATLIPHTALAITGGLKSKHVER